MDPDTTAASATVTVPGLADVIAAGADGCRVRVAEPAGFRVVDVSVGFTVQARRQLYRQSLRTDDRNREALGAAEAALTSALTHYVTHDEDLRDWAPTDDGRMPGEAVLRLRLVHSIRAVAVRPVYHDITYLVVPRRQPRSRDKLQIVVPSTVHTRRLIVLGRDPRTGRVRYQVMARRGLRVRYDARLPPYAPCSDSLRPSRCTDDPRASA